MEEEILLSVIVPIYNGRKTLTQCIESILQEDKIGLEIICVDDESTDDSLALCKRIGENDKRINVLSKVNGGVASARNIGMDMAKGKYITFVDQDDWIEKNAYKVMLDLAEKENMEMVVCNYTKDDINEIRPMKNRKKVQEKIQTTEELIKYAFFREEYRGFAAFVWNKIFKRDFLRNNNINFDSSLRRGDDVLFFCNVALASPKTGYVNQCLYHYVQRPDSVTHTLTKDNIECLSEILYGYKRAIENLEEHNISAEALGYMKCFFVYHASILYELAQKNDMRNECEIFRRAMRLYLKEYIKQNECFQDRIKRIYSLI